jgi:mannose-6-phosphate isomerase-like protein (cupin superfamily)
VLATLQDLAKNYARVKPKEYTGTLNMDIEGRFFAIAMEKESVSVSEGRSEKAIAELVLSEETYARLLDGTWNGMTAAGRENIRQSAPLDFRFLPGHTFSGQLLQMLYHLGMHFFQQSYPSVFRFGPAHTRLVHGGHAVPLAYGHGIRFAYYTISGDERINDDDAADPFDQVISVIGGKGLAVIDGVEVALERGIAVHVPPRTTHLIKATGSERLELFWVAYGSGA